MTEEEKQELETLRAKETLDENEKARVAELEAKEEPLNDEDEFDQAFDEAIGDEPKTEEETEDQDDNQNESQSGKDEDDQTEDDSLFETVPDDQDNGNEDEKSPEQLIADLEANLAKEKQRNSSWEGRIRAANRRAEEAEAKLNKKSETADKGSNDSLPNDDEDNSILSEFIEEFPSLEKPIKLLATQIARKIVEEEVGSIRPTIDSVKDTIQSQTMREHVGKIETAHPDWKQIRDSGSLITWIEKQPKFVQPGLTKVVEEGSAEEIIELFDTYKRSTGQKRTVNTGTKTAQQKARELEAVPHSSKGPPADKKIVDKNDYDSAWDEAVSKS